MNHNVRQTTIKAFLYPSRDVLKTPVLTFITAYNFAKHLKALRRRASFQSIRGAWTKDPAPFRINPHHLIPRPRPKMFDQVGRCPNQTRVFRTRLNAVASPSQRRLIDNQPA